MDPNLVRGKKIKNKEGGKKLERDTCSPETSQSEDDVHYVKMKPMMMTPPSSMMPQEDILKRKAEILRCQGAYLQFQASLLEREAHNTKRITEERVRVMKEAMMGVYKEEEHGGQYHHGQWSAPVKSHHHHCEESYDARPVCPEYREERVLHHQNPQEPQDDGCPDDDDDEDDHPLDLSVNSSPVNLHAQSQNMPRIFFSLSGRSPTIKHQMYLET